jgi:hypothetical protein
MAYTLIIQLIIGKISKTLTFVVRLRKILFTITSCLEISISLWTRSRIKNHHLIILIPDI